MKSKTIVLRIVEQGNKTSGNHRLESAGFDAEGTGEEVFFYIGEITSLHGNFSNGTAS